MMAQYLPEIKLKVDSLTASDAHIEIEDIIYYTLNGLPPSYQAFKVAIHTQLQPISLDDLYSLLCSEETLLQAEALRAESSNLQNLALTMTRSDFHRKPPSRGSYHGRSIASRERGKN